MKNKVAQFRPYYLFKNFSKIFFPTQLNAQRWYSNNNTSFIFNRSLLQHEDEKIPAVAFDICGVLTRGPRLLPQARNAILKVRSCNIPFVLVTNGSGGGTTEEKKAEQMSNLLDIKIKPEQIVLGHSPMRTEVKQFGKERVLVAGAGPLLEVATKYGFQNVITVDDILIANPKMYPFLHLDLYNFTYPNRNEAISKKSVLEEEIKAIFVLNDPLPWEINMQILLDVLRSDKGKLNTRALPSTKILAAASQPQIPLFFSTPDIEWSADYPYPRLGQGAFRKSLETLYADLSKGKKLQYTLFGKPSLEIYRYAKSRLQDYVSKQYNGKKKLGGIYAIGDNLETDVIGANKTGWTSILCKTGNYEETDEANSIEYLSEDKKPKYIVDDVGVAVNLILDIESKKKEEEHFLPVQKQVSSFATQQMLHS